MVSLESSIGTTTEVFGADIDNICICSWIFEGKPENRKKRIFSTFSIKIITNISFLKLCFFEKCIVLVKRSAVLCVKTRLARNARIWTMRKERLEQKERESAKDNGKKWYTNSSASLAFFLVFGTRDFTLYLTRTIILTDHIIIKSNEIKIKGSRFQNRFFQGEKNLLIGLLCCVSPPPMAIAAIRLRLLASSEPVPEFVGAWTTTIGFSLVVNTGEFEVSRDIPGNSIIDKILSSVVVVLFERATTDDRVSCRRKLKMSRERRSEAENKIDCTIFTLDIFFILKSGRFIFVRFFFSKFRDFWRKKDIPENGRYLWLDQEREHGAVQLSAWPEGLLQQKGHGASRY